MWGRCSFGILGSWAISGYKYLYGAKKNSGDIRIFLVSPPYTQNSTDRKISNYFHNRL
jgi:hypothetical protein